MCVDDFVQLLSPPLPRTMACLCVDVGCYMNMYVNIRYHETHWKRIGCCNQWLQYFQTGEGGYGLVYKGKLRQIAKLLSQVCINFVCICIYIVIPRVFAPSRKVKMPPPGQWQYQPHLQTGTEIRVCGFCKVCYNLYYGDIINY